MNRTPAADTRSPWYEAFTPAAGAPETQPATRWLVGTALPAPVEAAARPTDADDEWATQALFDCYNG